MSSRDDVAALRGKLTEWRILAGQPSLRAMAQHVGWSHATVGRVFTGDSVPRWDVVEALTAHLHGNVAEIRTLWVACMEPEAPTAAAHSAPDHRFPRVSGTAALCAFILMVSLQGVLGNRGIWSQSINDFVQIVCGALASAKWFRNFSRNGDRLSLALSIGMAGWSLGQVFWFLSRDVFEQSFPASPSIGDAAYTLLPLCVFVAFSSTFTYRSGIACGAAILLGTIACTALLNETTGSSLGFNATYSAYWITDVLMFLLFARAFRRERTWSMGLVALAMLMLLPADVLLLYFGAVHGGEPMPYGIYTGYVAFTLLMSVSADCARKEREAIPVP